MAKSWSLLLTCLPNCRASHAFEMVNKPKAMSTAIQTEACHSPWENNPSGKRFPLFDKDGNPDPHISPKEKEANTGRKTRVKEIE